MRFKAKITGAKELQRDLKRLDRDFKRLENKARRFKGEVPFETLLSPAFMQKHTPYKSIAEMLTASGYEASGTDDLQKISEEDLDTIVKDSTAFSSWQEMLAAAGTQYVDKKMGF